MSFEEMDPKKVTAKKEQDEKNMQVNYIAHYFDCTSAKGSPDAPIGSYLPLLSSCEVERWSYFNRTPGGQTCQGAESIWMAAVITELRPRRPLRLSDCFVCARIIVSL